MTYKFAVAMYGYDYSETYAVFDTKEDAEECAKQLNKDIICDFYDKWEVSVIRSYSNLNDWKEWKTEDDAAKEKLRLEAISLNRTKRTIRKRQEASKPKVVATVKTIKEALESVGVVDYSIENYLGGLRISTQRAIPKAKKVALTFAANGAPLEFEKV